MITTPDAIPAVVALLNRRPDLRGVYPLADTIDQAARWSA